MSYIVKQVGKKYHIHETEGDVTIPLHLTKVKANQVARKLNLGSGFGVSPIPSFFCGEFKSVNA
jgi:hypothetical protein